ncbi:MAG: ATP synthase F1 subunit delta [Pyrinomonadaceae bacterium]
MSVETVARRYATALADVVGTSNEAEAIRGELGEWGNMISQTHDLHSAFTNPSIPHAGKERLLNSLLEKTLPSRTTANFLRILLRNGRLTELSHINERFAAELEERSGIVSAEIVSARELPESERTELRSNLEKLSGKKVNINFNIDTELIGGVVARLGSTVYDGSVKTQLENLKEQLVNG